MTPSAATADAIFGVDWTATQPTADALPTHMGRPEPVARTIAAQPRGPLDSPAAVLVALLAAAVVLMHLISRG